MAASMADGFPWSPVSDWEFQIQESDFLADLPQAPEILQSSSESWRTPVDIRTISPPVSDGCQRSSDDVDEYASISSLEKTLMSDTFPSYNNALETDVTFNGSPSYNTSSENNKTWNSCPPYPNPLENSVLSYAVPPYKTPLEKTGILNDLSPFDNSLEDSVPSSGLPCYTDPLERTFDQGTVSSRSKVVGPTISNYGISVDDFLSSFSSSNDESIQTPKNHLAASSFPLSDNEQKKYEWVNSANASESSPLDFSIFPKVAISRSDPVTLSMMHQSNVDLSSSFLFSSKSPCSLPASCSAASDLNICTMQKLGNCSEVAGPSSNQTHFHNNSTRFLTFALEKARTQKPMEIRVVECADDLASSKSIDGLDFSLFDRDTVGEATAFQTSSNISSILYAPSKVSQFDLKSGSFSMPTNNSSAQILVEGKDFFVNRMTESCQSQKPFINFNDHVNLLVNGAENRAVNSSSSVGSYPCLGPKTNQRMDTSQRLDTSQKIDTSQCENCKCQTSRNYIREKNSAKEMSEDRVKNVTEGDIQRSDFSPQTNSTEETSKERDQKGTKHGIQRPDLSSRLAALVKSHGIVKKTRPTPYSKFPSIPQLETSTPCRLAKPHVSTTNYGEVFSLVSSSDGNAATNSTHMYHGTSPQYNSFLRQHSSMGEGYSSWASEGEPLEETSIPLNGFGERMLYKGLLDLAKAVTGRDKAEIKRLENLIGPEATANGSPMQRILLFFMEALSVRMAGTGNEVFEKANSLQLTPELELSVMSYVTKLPGLIFWCLGSVETLFESVKGEEYVHIVDVASWGGLWPSLLTQLATQTSTLNIPKVKFTIIEQPPGEPVGFGPQFSVQEVKKELEVKAWELGMEVEVDVLCVPLQQLRSVMVKRDEREAVAVFCGLRISTLPDSSVVRWSPRDTVLRAFRELNPRVLVMLNIEADLNSSFFMPRFRAAIKVFWAFLDANERVGLGDVEGRICFEKMLQSDITNVVACEGTERRFRCETGERIASRMTKLGYKGGALKHISFDIPVTNELKRVCNGSMWQLSYRGIPTVGISSWAPMAMN